VTLFHTDSVTLSYSDVEAAKRWWISAFDCKQVKVPPDWDNSLPSDVALSLPGDREATILLSDRAEVKQAGFDRSSTVVPVIFSGKLKRAHDQLSSRGVIPGPIQGDSETQFFEVRDPEGNVIEICEEH
jgi:catechol 2,3-dioxygenase-like lactoylglutathione lyase family enzyme